MDCYFKPKLLRVAMPVQAVYNHLLRFLINKTASQAISMRDYEQIILKFLLFFLVLLKMKKANYTAEVILYLTLILWPPPMCTICPKTN